MPLKSPQEYREEAQRMRAQEAVYPDLEIKEQLLKVAAEYERLATYLENPRLDRSGSVGT